MTTSSDFNILQLEALCDLLQITDGTPAPKQVVELANPAVWVRTIVRQQRQAENDLRQLTELCGNMIKKTDQQMQQIEQAYLTLAEDTRYVYDRVNANKEIAEAWVRSELANCQDLALTTLCYVTGNVGSVLRGKLVVTLPAYSCVTHSLAVSVTPSMVSLWSSDTPCLGSLFSQCLSRLAWSCRGLLTCLAWTRCSRGIRHAWRDLVAVFPHALCGLVVLAVSVTPGIVSLWSSHMPCMGSLFLRYQSRLAWSHHGLLIRLAWARCSYWGWWLQRRFMGRER